MIAFLMLNISKTVKDIKLKFCMCVCGTEVFKKRHLILKEFDKKKLGGPIYIYYLCYFSFFMIKLLIVKKHDLNETSYLPDGIWYNFISRQASLLSVFFCSFWTFIFSTPDKL